MKKIQDVIRHLPIPYEKLKIQKCLKMLIKGLPIRYQNNISYYYLKRKTFYIAIKHPALAFELYQKVSEIRVMLKLIQKKTGKCQSIEIEKIKTFIAEENRDNSKKENSTFLSFKQQAKGDFENRAKNKSVYEKFEEIRKIVKKGREK